MSEKFNVVVSSDSGFKWSFVLILFFACPKDGVTEECSFLKCTLNTMSFISSLRRDNSRFDCGKFLDMEGCSDHCMHVYYPQKKLSNLEPYGISHFCSTKIALNSVVNWQCIARHAFRLLACLGNVSSFTNNNVREHAIAEETCKKSLEFPKCASTVLLSDCGESSAEQVKDILQYAVNYFMPSACKNMNQKKITSMSVHFQIENRFMEMTRCMDSDLTYIISCFRQMLQDDLELKQFVCGEGEAFTSCVAYTVRKQCKEMEYDVDDTSVKKLLLKFFSVGGIRCEQPQYAFPHLTSHNLTHSHETKSSLIEQVDSLTNHPSLNDYFHVLSKPNSDFFNLSTTQTSINSGETLASSGTSMASNYDVKNMNSTKKVHASESLLNNSRDPSQFTDSNNVKTSSSLNLIFDKTLIISVYILISILL